MSKFEQVLANCCAQNTKFLALPDLSIHLENCLIEEHNDQWCRNQKGGGTGGQGDPPLQFVPILTVGGQILPTLYYWHLQNFSPSGITGDGIYPWPGDGIHIHGLVILEN